jgi:uncharacterized protein (TIGR03067 family)
LMGSAALAEKPEPTDRDQLKGEWVEEGGEYNGKKTAGRSRLVFAGGTLKILSKDGKHLWYETRFNLDEAATPKQITAEVTDTGPPEGKFDLEFPGQIVGIYVVDKDTLKICWGNSPRPTELESKTKFHYYGVYKRESK